MWSVLEKKLEYLKYFEENFFNWINYWKGLETRKRKLVDQCTHCTNSLVIIFRSNCNKRRAYTIFPFSRVFFINLCIFFRKMTEMLKKSCIMLLSEFWFKYTAKLSEQSVIAYVQYSQVCTLYVCTIVHCSH